MSSFAHPLPLKGRFRSHGSQNLKDFANIWVHNGFVTVEGEKMAKSAGNFLLVHDLIENVHGEVLRFTLLSAHYRQPLDWSEDKVHQSRKQLDKFYARLDEMHNLKANASQIPEGVLAALCDDLNT